MPLNRQQKAYVYAGATILLWSTVASAFKLSLRHLHPLQLLLWADVFSILCLGTVLGFSGRFRLLATYSKNDLMRAAGLGALNPFLYYVILFAAYDLLPAQEAQPLNYTWAITLSLLAIPLLKQPIGARELAAIFISYFGVVIIFTRGDPLAMQFSSGPGVVLALGSTVVWALYWIYSTRDHHDPVAGLFLNFVFALPLILVTCTIFSDPRPASVPGLIGAAYVGVFEMGITFVLWLTALKLTKSTSRISTLIFFSPFLSLVFIHLLVGEMIRVSTVAGLALIVAGSLLQRTSSLKSTH
ncbi:MAG: DMT family transporter [Desulfosalsimonas sp.]|uniref:DMT family transporter n=1 Tax=Desulfosalsimonas sp. TaxID=3073848 RepID=UPI003970C163